MSLVQEQPCEVSETVVLEREHPETFAACVVTCAMSQSADVSVTREKQPVVELADTFVANLTGVGECSQFSREVLVAEQGEDPTLAPLRETAMSFEESQNVAEGFYLDAKMAAT